MHHSRRWHQNRGEEVGIGFNVANGAWVNIVQVGNVDPTKATRLAFQNAASVAAMFLTIEAVVVDIPDMGGMMW